MSYVVLARKWRPKHFEEVVGQGHVARTLKNSIAQNRVAHAYLFTGARGVGKTSTARILAKALNCKEGPTDVPCYQCNSCTEILRGQSVDVFEIDGASNRGINEIRELREGVRYAPSRDRYKIYIIDEVHMLTTEAFNALLKTLEEPPSHAIFLFATTEPQKIPVTILSRCQRFDFKRIGQRDIVEHLSYLCKEEEIEADRAALQLIARQASGGMRDAVSLLDQIISFAGRSFTEAQIAEILGVANRRHLFELSEAIFSRDAGKALVVLEEVNSYGYDLQQFAAELVNHLRDLMVVAVVDDAESVTDLTATELANAQNILKAYDVSAHLIHRYFSLMVQGAQDMHRSVFPKLIFEMVLVRMAQLEPLVGLDVMIDKLRVMEDELAHELGIEPDSVEKKTPELTHISAALPQAVSPPEYKETPSSPAVFIPASAPEPEPAPEAPVVEPAIAEAIVEPIVEPSVVEPPALVVVPDDEYSDDEYLDAGYLDDEGSYVPVAEVVPAPEVISSEEEIIDDELVRWRPDKVENPGALTTPQRWALVIENMMKGHPPTAATYEHAYLETFDDGKVALSFEEQYFEFAKDPVRMALVTEFIQALFGDDYKLTVELQHQPETLEIQTIAQEREAETERRIKQVEADVRNNPVVQKAQAIFEITDLTVQVDLADR